MPERPLCACGNLCEQVGIGLGYRRVCSSCRKRRIGRPIGGFQVRREQIRNGLVRNECADCGCTHENEGFFDVHHRNGNAFDNSFENLAVLCPNCHRERHLAEREAKQISL